MNFFEESILVADNFIKTICFIDDQPFFHNSEDPTNDDIDHRLNANAITKVFASGGKCCTFYQYSDVSEERSILTLTKVADVNIIDWKLILTKNILPSFSEAEGTEVATITGKEFLNINSEQDVDEKESRGRYSLKLIEGILKQEYASPKLIIVYTAEPFPEEIFSAIREKLTQLKIDCESNLDELCFQNSRFRIAIYFKEAPRQKYLSAEVRQKMLLIDDFPTVINKEFATLTNSFIPQAAIECISAVRANTFLLLDAYSKELDPAYLTHRALLANANDAEEQLIDIIGSDIKGILKNGKLIEDLKRRMPKYLDSKYNNNEYEVGIPDIERMPSLQLSPAISKATLESIVINGVESTFFQRDQPNEEKLIFSKNCHKWLTKAFASGEEAAEKSDVLFAIRTTIKPTYNQSNFLLSLGTILKEEKNNSYWLCIQPKCDSVRIEQKKRPFLLLRLKITTQDNFHIVVYNGKPVFLKVDYRVYSSESIDFMSDEKGNVSSIYEVGLVKFKRGDNKKMLWVAELKSDYAQSISNRFSSELSRVGLDLSEWLRRCS